MKLLLRCLVAFAFSWTVDAVKELYTLKEYRDLMAEAGGRPVVIDYYSQSCGPCHMIAPVFRKISKQYAGRAYFRKVDVNRNRELAGSQQIRSMPTFQFFLSGKKRHQFSGADEGQLAQLTRQLVDEADRNDVVVSFEDLEAFYQKHEPSKATKESLDKIIEKNKKDYGTMVRLLKKKYGEAPKTSPAPKKQKTEKGKTSTSQEKAAQGKPLSLSDVSIEELKQELEKREEEAAEERIEQEEVRLRNNPCALYRNRTSGAIEKVVIVGGGPAGMTAAIYAARANLCPLVIAPPIGGQLMAKGVDVENYPGLPRENGGKMVQIFKQQAQSFFAEVRDDMVVRINTSVRPFEIELNETGTLQTHTLIMATGADSRWLGVPGEWELRGQGVSSCAACDGYLFRGRACAVIGGGDTAMEEALMLSRICDSVTLLLRRDKFRASETLVERVKANKQISIRYNVVVSGFKGQTVKNEETGEESQALHSIALRSTVDTEAEETSLEVDAAFIAIGHDPNTALLKGQVDMTESNYIVNPTKSTATTVPGVFTCGDVSDFVYRQAITSAGTGAMAALDVEKYLSEHPIVDEEACVKLENFADWTVKELRAHASLLSLKCKGCNEKEHYVDLLRSSYM